jgi:hypothetical protein
MTICDPQARRKRLQRECEVSAVPSVLLAAACLVLVGLLALDSSVEAIQSACAHPVTHAVNDQVSKP